MIDRPEQTFQSRADEQPDWTGVTSYCAVNDHWKVNMKYQQKQTIHNALRSGDYRKESNLGLPDYTGHEAALPHVTDLKVIVCVV
jgi:hypothetical protein